MIRYRSIASGWQMLRKFSLNPLSRNRGCLCYHRLFATSNSNGSLRKVVASAEEALKGIDLQGATLAIGGFGLGGIPESLISAVSGHEGAQDLTLISLTAGTDQHGTGKILSTGKARKLIAAYVGENDFLERAYHGGTLQVELTPMGTIAERLRSGGAGTSTCEREL